METKKDDVVMLVCGEGLRVLPEEWAEPIRNFMKQEQQNDGAN